MLAQRDYVASAIDHILSLYPPDTQILLLGHSMGGIVSMSLLPSSKISAIITMSSPASLPPAKLDRRMEELYSRVYQGLYHPAHQSNSSLVPVVSLCGGATDMQIPSETCHLPTPPTGFQEEAHRRTVFTSGLTGAWTGVGHNVMVWCHQVRWRVARAALELATKRTVHERERVLDRWFTAGPLTIDSSRVLAPPPHQSIEDLASQHIFIDPSPQQLELPSHRYSSSSGTTMYLLPSTSHITLFVSRGAFISNRETYGHLESDLKVEIFTCFDNGRSCIPFDSSLEVTTIPLPRIGQNFPAPNEGTKPSNVGVIVDADQSTAAGSQIGLRISGTMDAGHRGVLVDWREKEPFGQMAGVYCTSSANPRSVIVFILTGFYFLM